MNLFKTLAFMAIFVAGSVQLSAQSKVIQKGVGDEIHQEARIAGACDKALDAEKLADCANEALAMAVYKSLQYPAAARKAGTQGTVIVGFSVEKDGRLTDPHVKQDIGNGCGEACINALINMNAKFTPAKNKNGEAVISYVQMPVKFSLR